MSALRADRVDLPWTLAYSPSLLLAVTTVGLAGAGWLGWLTWSQRYVPLGGWPALAVLGMLFAAVGTGAGWVLSGRPVWRPLWVGLCVLAGLGAINAGLAATLALSGKQAFAGWDGLLWVLVVPVAWWTVLIGLVTWRPDSRLVRGLAQFPWLPVVCWVLAVAPLVLARWVPVWLDLPYQP